MQSYAPSHGYVSSAFSAPVEAFKEGWNGDVTFQTTANLKISRKKKKKKKGEPVTERNQPGRCVEHLTVNTTGPFCSTETTVSKLSGQLLAGMLKGPAVPQPPGLINHNVLYWSGACSRETHTQKRQSEPVSIQTGEKKKKKRANTASYESVKHSWWKTCKYKAWISELNTLFEDVCDMRREPTPHSQQFLAALRSAAISLTLCSRFNSTAAGSEPNHFKQLGLDQSQKQLARSVARKCLQKCQAWGKVSPQIFGQVIKHRRVWGSCQETLAPFLRNMQGGCQQLILQVGTGAAMTNPLTMAERISHFGKKL